MQRFYRNRIKSAGKYSFNVIIEESDLFIVCDKNLEQQANLALEYARKKIEKYIDAHPEFRDSLVPVNITGNSSCKSQIRSTTFHPEPQKIKEPRPHTSNTFENNHGLQSGGNDRNNTGPPTVSTVSQSFSKIPIVSASPEDYFNFDPPIPDIIRTMSDAARLYNVGPMAAVAGAVAGYVGEKLLQECIYIMIENGGDIFIKSDEPFTLAVWAGENSPFNGKLNLKIDPGGKPLGICTSSGMFGHSLSFGKADAVVAISPNPALADAAATAIANRIQTKEDVRPVADEEQEKGILEGLIIIKDDRAAIWGDFEVV